MADGATEANGASGGDIRASILSELAAGPKDDAPAEVEAGADEETAAQDEAVEDEAVEAGAEDVEVAADEEAPTDDEPAEPDEEAVTDPKVAKGLDQVRRAEKHARAKLDADRAALEQERKQHETAISELETFKTLAKRAKYDPAAVLRALGLEDDDFEVAAHSLYAESRAGASDPARKAAAQARLREREKEDKLTATERRIAELEAKLEQDKADRVAAAEAAQYIAELNATVAKTPLVAHLKRADADSVNEGLLATFDRLAKSGTEPTIKQVVAAYEKRERARLAALGVDLTKFGAAVKPVANTNGKKPAAPAKPVANTNGATKAPTRDEIVAELARLKADEKLTS